MYKGFLHTHYLVVTIFLLIYVVKTILLLSNKNDLLDLMGKRSEEVEKYAKTNRLKFDDKYDLARIVAYYNSLFGI